MKVDRWAAMARPKSLDGVRSWPRPALFSLCVLLSGIAFGADGFQARRLPANQQIHLDGTLNDAAWAGAPVYDSFFETQPVDNVAAKVRTEVKVLYDQRYLYIGVRAHDGEPGRIRSPFARRDKLSNDQDYIGLFLDSGGSAKSAQVIYVNARGAISDGSHSPAGGDNFAPDIDVDAATARFDGGWTMVARIPFASVAYVRDGTAPWKLLVMRNLTREQRYRMYSAPVTRNTNCILCFATPVAQLNDLPTGLSWSATPQLVMSRNRSEQTGSADVRTDKRKLSLDVKLRPDSASVVDLTIEPDFSQVELDAPQLSGNTRFGLFVLEKRPFFLEGSDLLQTPLRAINTRTIGQIGFGARYTRRGESSDLTALYANDRGDSLVQLPGPYGTGYARVSEGSKAALGRIQFKRGDLVLGMTGSERRYAGARGYNSLAGPDLSWQPGAYDRVRAQLLVSATTAKADGHGALVAGERSSGHAAMLDWSHDPQNWSLQGSLEDVSDGFRADNGFFSQVGYRFVNGQTSRKLGRTGPFNEMNLYFYADRRVDRSGALISTDIFPGIWIAGPLDSEFELHVKPANRTRTLAGGEVLTTALAGGRVGITPGPVLARLQAELTYGDQIDVLATRVGKGGTLTLYGRVRPSERLEFEPTYTINWIDGKDGAEQGQRLYTAQAAQLNGIYHFSAHDSLRMIAQWTRTERAPQWYALPVAARSTQQVASFVYGHTASFGTAAYAGLTLTRGDAPGSAPHTAQNEVFLKLSWQI
ncbi:carbohydrate binding family 9 domain-containing protein [Massilia sp. TWP1-3-3]|uniref:carbohydrate binding family 9 domain-containing protein n=1 Tax=Massilia sp. TWP1-3-3 TaxID=2804573 RepID=UPI003CF2B4CA